MGQSLEEVARVVWACRAMALWSAVEASSRQGTSEIGREAWSWEGIPIAAIYRQCLRPVHFRHPLL